jgi:hypothetical protein
MDAAPKMMATTKRPHPGFDQSPNAPKKPYSNSKEDTISSLLAKIEAKFQRRHDMKEESFMKWEQEGIFISLSPSIGLSPHPQPRAILFFQFLLIVKDTV